MAKSAAQPRKLRVVLDSNIWLSGLIFGGYSGDIIGKFVNGDILVVVSEELLSELRRKITEKFPGYSSKLALLEASLRKDAIMVRLGANSIKISRDPDDNRVIEAAYVGGCSHIITGDKDLLVLGAYKDTQIVTAKDFLMIEAP